MTEDSQSLFTRLLDYAQKDVVPMHMPGHKRNQDAAPYLAKLCAALDITEITGFDNLHAATGVLKDSMARASALWGSRRAWYLINGSTCGLLAGIRAATVRGDKVFIARNCHRAVYHAIEICGLNPIYAQPPIEPSLGLYASLSPESLEAILQNDPDIRLVILTSPTYEGVVSDIEGICALFHRYDIPVLVDEAHGAHLGLSPYFPAGAVRLGADIVVQSLHKTLPSLTQTAILHLCGDRVSQEAVSRALAVFESSSPSYLLLASIDGCVRWLEDNSEEIFTKWQDRLARFDEAAKALRRLKTPFHGNFGALRYPSVFTFDAGKLIVSTRGTDLSGPALFRALRDDYGIEAEMAAGDYVIAMTGAGDRDQDLERMSRALLEIDQKCEARAEEALCDIPPLPERVAPPGDVAFAKWHTLPIDRAVGAVCAEYIFAYPPGIPLIVPGERVGEPLVSALSRMVSRGVSIQSTYARAPETVAVMN